MGLTGKNVEEKIWNFLIGKGFSKAGAAGLMGNLFAESGLNPKNLQNSFEKKLGHTDDSYTAAVDNGTYSNFVKDSAGYGLAQWTYWSRKQNMLEFARAAGKSIGDLEMQLDFLFKELSEGYKTVLAALKTATSVKAASDNVLLRFEKPADQSDAVKAKRAGYGQTYYDKYAGDSTAAAGNGGTTMTEKEARQKFVNYAVSYLGCKESNDSHKKIIDLYNSHKPLARGYKVQYTDAWCATYVSAMAIGIGYEDVIPLECGCSNYIDLAKAAGIWVETDSYKPDIGDIVLYDWQDGTNYATTDNRGNPDHIGIVASVTGNTLRIIEGNISNSVGYRTLQVNGRYIRGWVTPKYSSKATSGSTSGGSSTNGATTGNKLKVGDVVNFTGSKHYISANDTNGKNCKPGKAKITQIYQLGKSKHPYHIVAENGGGSNVYGWVDEADVKSSTAAASYVTYTVKKGDSLWAIAAKQLGNGNRYKEIKSLNVLSSDTIYPGQTLKLPN